MRTFLATRPLALAGPAAVAGVLLARTSPGWPACLGLMLLLWWFVQRTPIALLLVAALAAGLGAGARVQHRIAAIPRGDRSGTRQPWPRAPPRAGTCTLEVVACGEDPLLGRAWIEGRRDDGAGVLCAWAGTLRADLGPGARVRVAGRFHQPAGPGNPGELDLRERLAARGIAMRADLRTGRNVVVVRPARGPRAWLNRARRAGARRLARVLPRDAAPIAMALLLGVRGGIEPEDRHLFERTGTLHILAISGMHVLLLAGVVHQLVRALGGGVRTAAAVALTLALLYVPVAGGAPPIRRAVTVLVFYGIALVRGRPPDVASALGGAALTLALADPAEVFGVGFRLSFAAAAGIAWLAPSWHRRWSRRHRLLARFPAVRQDRRVRLLVHGYVLRALPVALAAWLATQAFVAQSFGLVTPFAPFTNVLIGPAVALLLPAIALVACGVTALAGVVAMKIQLVRALLSVAAGAPGGLLLVALPSSVPVLIWLLGCILLRKAPRRGVAALALALLAAQRPATTHRDGLALLDVGHGQALLLRTADGRAALVDAGSISRPGVGRRTIVPALRALGIERLDLAVCTHGDADHSNALPDVLSLIPTRRLLVGPDPPAAVLAAARRYGVCVVTARDAGDLLGSATARLRILAPGPASEDRNNRSLALVFETAGGRVLLPADRGTAGLSALLREGLSPCRVLVAPHHGARCDLAAALGAAVRPRLLLVSAPAAFPHAPTLAAYGARAIRHTARDGCVLVWLSEGRSPTVETFRACYDPPP